MDRIYVTTDVKRGTELRCKDHPEWVADADWTVMDEAFRQATSHLETEHKG